MTHYLPAFTTYRLSRQRAVCGAFIAPAQHSTEPSCAACVAWLEADDKVVLALREKWDGEDVEKNGRP